MNENATQIQGKIYQLPHRAYVVLAEDDDALDYTITFKGKKLNDVIALVRLAREE